MKKELSVLMAFLMLSMALMLAKPASAAAPTYGPRADALKINIYASDVAEFAAFDAGEIDVVDTLLPEELIDKYSNAPFNESVVLSPVLGPGMPGSYLKKGMPDLGQHSSGWCWVAALANSLIWYDKHVYPGLVPAASYQIDPESTDPTKNGITGPNWYCPPTNPGDPPHGYMKLFKEIAMLTPDSTDNDGDGRVNCDPIDGIDNDGDGRIDEDPPHKVFCQTVFNEEYETMLSAYFVLRGYSDKLGWEVIPDPGHDPSYPSFDDYKIQLARSEDVILIIGDVNGNPEHDVTGVSYDDTKDPPEIGISDPWTPSGPDHNNEIGLIKDRYGKVTVHQRNPLKINYGGEVCPIVKMYHISPKTPHKAYRRPMAYAVNAKATGTTNSWTMLAAYNTTSFYGNTIRWGFKSDVQMINPLYSSWVWDNYVLAEIFDGVLAVNPYNLALDMPWVASGFETGTYLNGTGAELSRVILTIRDGVRWHDGVPLTANDVKFSYDYIKQFDDCWLYSAVADIVSTSVVGNQVIIDFDVLSVWALHWIMGIYLIPKHIYEEIPDPHGFVPGGGANYGAVLVGCGPYKWWQYSSGEYFTLLANRDYFKKIHPTGDVNFDQVVDIYDIIHVAASFGLARGEAGYDIIADVIAEWDLVDIYDLILVAGQFGDYWEPYP